MTQEKTRFYTVKQFAEKNKKEGVWPDTEGTIWAYRANSPKNGFGKAFLCIGRRVLINEIEFQIAIQAQGQQDG